ncbi:hypothetical protein GBAR_LOCUS21129 [Geodia barretti]|uniref:Ig-like domain-containing protein n=1 Tax=Geodia barretti TaxID=519541 RepID=A0AA35X4S7_GEOBA|nr:hypothetical protein GBAR_LOCUS21129 [Geodia barretti]
MRVSVVVYLCLLALERVKCVPSTLQPSCGTELVRVERGSTLNLQCGSYCSESSEYTWWKMSEQDETRVQLSFSGAVVTEDKVTEESGGDYECQCGSSGQICTFYVAVLPEITFTASHTATHYGDVVILTCLVEGNPANFTTITNSYGILLQSQVKRKINSFRLETTAVVHDIEEEDYECQIELHYKGIQ